MPTMKLAAYMRVSTDAQAEQGFGLPIQADTIARWARDKKHTISQWHQDAGVSGTNGIDNRPGLAYAIEAVRKKEVRGIVVARLDRLARDLVLQEQLLAEVRRLGGRVYSCSGGEDDYLRDDPSDPSRRLIRQVLGAVAEYERGMIRLRMTAGIERKRAEGGYYGGRPPYGWRARSGELVPDPAEQSQIQLMLAARSQGASFAEVALMLNRLEVPTKHGGRWQKNTIRRILNHPRVVALTGAPTPPA